MIEDWAWTHARAPVEHFMRTPGFQEWWALRKDWFGDEFQDFVGDRMPETTGALVDDFRRVTAGTDPQDIAAGPLTSNG